jgi:superfamily II DNA or RNA helicase
VVRGFRSTPYGSLAKAELITSSKSEADAMSASLSSSGFRVSVEFFSQEKPDDIRHLILLKAANQLDDEFFKGILLNVRA